ncbi:unnamed protein product [Clonostachys byssicola]|uniref:Uncharacterized protein n=1 Tax=Clonostachys byssicola TaxID=160290 RepID=A0A9N9UHD2_9HYPO|nr:unnamed protein product [Clonostachys byssicola]
MPPVRPLPLEVDDVSLWSEAELDELYEKVIEILASHEIRRPEPQMLGPWSWDEDYNRFLFLLYRSIPGVPDSARLTLLVTTEWNDSSAENWERAVQEIKPFALSFLKQEVDVEIIGSQLTKSRDIRPLGHHPLIQDNWDAISGEIKEVLQRHPASRGTMTAITVFRMGNCDRDEDMPITVYVSVSHDCPEASWPPIIDDINKILEPYPLELFFEHNHWQPTAFEPLPPSSKELFPYDFVRRPYQSCPDLGADIGAAQYIECDGQRQSPPMGTLGCYVDFKTIQGEQKTMALTCYHVCRPCAPGFTYEKGKPGTESVIPLPAGLPEAFDRSGIRPDHAYVLSGMEHPSRQRHNVNIAWLNAKLQKDLRENKRPNAEERLDAAHRAFDEGANILGKIWAASGFGHRSATNFFLEWALIEVQPSRQGRNQLPGLSVWESQYDSLDWPDEEAGAMDHLKMYRHGTALGTLEPGTKVYKHGAASGLTVGHYQGVKSHVGPSMNNPSGASTNAYLVESFGTRPFCGPGDSGAVVYDAEGHALGLVFDFWGYREMLRSYRPANFTAN